MLKDNGSYYAGNVKNVTIEKMSTTLSTHNLESDNKITTLGLDLGNTLTPLLTPYFDIFWAETFRAILDKKTATIAWNARKDLEYAYWAGELDDIIHTNTQLVEIALQNAGINDPRIAKRITAIVEKRFIIETPAIEGVEEFFIKAHQRGLKIGILSNWLFDEESIWQWLHVNDCSRYVHGVVVSSKTHMLKPNKQMFQHFGENLAEPDMGKIAYLGDRFKTDIQGARDAGMIGIWLNHDGALESPTSNEIFDIKNKILAVTTLLDATKLLETL